MGTSNWQNISYCINIIRKINPQKILDFGVGFGRWGILAREFLEVWEGKVHSNEWTLQIDGVEKFNSNIEDYHNYFYSSVYNIDAFEYIKTTTEYYDLIITGDMLEHLEKKIALEFLNVCLSKSNYIMINIPIGRGWEQDEIYGNKYEKHLSIWKINEFKKFNMISHRVFRDYIFRKFAVIILSKNKNVIPFSRDFRQAVKFNIKKYFS